MKKPLVIIVVLAIVILSIAGCGVAGYFIYNNVIKKAQDNDADDSLAENLAEELIGEGTGTDIDIDSDGKKVTIEGEDGTAEIEASEDNTWPSDMPNDVPEFTYGTIESITRTTLDEAKGWTVTLADVQSGAIGKYATDLESKGWEIMKIESDEGGTITGEKDGLSVFVMLIETDKTGSLSVAYES